MTPTLQRSRQFCATVASAERRSTAAEQIANLLHARAPTLGDNRLVCIDGPAGSGKSTLAEQLRQETVRRGLAAAVLHMDDLYRGWDGLPEVGTQLSDTIRPLVDERSGTYRRWDWRTGRYAEEHVLRAVPVLIIEGVGAAASTIADLTTLTVWVGAPHDLRRRRAIERDGASFAPQWEHWAEAERRHFAAEATPTRADLTVDGVTGAVTRGPVC